MSTMKQQTKAYLFAIVTVLLWSTVATAFKIALREYDTLPMVCFSSLTAAIALFVIIIAQGKLTEMRSCNKRDLLKSAGLGLINPLAYYLVLFKAYELLPAQEAQPLNYVWPIMLVLISIPMLKQKISHMSFIAILVSFFGVMIISTHGKLQSYSFSHMGGAALALGSSLLWASYWIMNVKDHLDATIRLFLNFCFGFLFSMIATVSFSDMSFSLSTSGIAVIYVGLFEMGITFLLWSNALKYSETTAKVSNLIFFSPFLSLIWIHLILGEQIYPSTIVGLFLIVLGIILHQYFSRRSR